MKTKKAVWFSAFKRVVPADYENWLERMALQGWNIDEIGQWSSIYLVLQKTTPKKYRYVYDIQPAPKKDNRETYEQFGWECIGVMASCYIWRKEYSGERPQAFSDAQSIEDRNKRDMRAVAVSLSIFTIAFLVTLAVFLSMVMSLTAGDIIQFAAGLLLLGGIALCLALVMRNIYKNLHE